MSRAIKYLRWMAIAAVAGCAGFAYGINSAAPQEVAAVQIIQEDPMDRFRTEREQLRAMQRAQLNDMLHGGSADAEITGMAQRQLMEINDAENMESTLEGILGLRGFENCVVTVNNGSVNVLIRAEIITQQESSMILDLACRETGAQAGNVKIIPVN